MVWSLLSYLSVDVSFRVHASFQHPFGTDLYHHECWPLLEEKQNAVMNLVYTLKNVSSFCNSDSVRDLEMGALCIKSIVISLFLVLWFPRHLWLLLPSGYQPIMVPKIDKQLPRFKVNVLPLSVGHDLWWPAGFLMSCVV